MEDVLDVYQRPEDAHFPLICFDETPVQLISEVRQSIPGKRGAQNVTITNTTGKEQSICFCSLPRC